MIHIPPSSPSPHPDPKTAARRDFRQRRQDHVAGLADRAADEAALAARLMPLIPTSITVASYAATGSEIDPAILHPALAGLAFPRVGRTFLTFHICRPTALVPGHAGIPEPVSTAPRVTPAILLVPLLAATPAGVRLGQGGGFYDRALAALRAQGPILAIGLAWDLQLAHSLPSDPWDQPLDLIATPTRLVECAAFR